jgi:putative membrane protein
MTSNLHTYSRAGLLGFLAISLSLGCASDQKSTVSAEEVRDGEALPPAPPVPARPASTDSPTAPTVPGGAAAAAPSPEATPAKAQLSEAQIAKLSELVNGAEVEQAKLAQRKAKSADVRKFAGKLLEHHGAALREQAKLSKKLNLTPASSGTAETLKADAEKTLANLQKTEPAGFDEAFVRAQIDAHQKVLELIDTEALPAATTPEVVDALRAGRGMVEQHLKEAQALQAK